MYSIVQSFIILNGRLLKAKQKVLDNFFLTEVKPHDAKSFRESKKLHGEESWHVVDISIKRTAFMSNGAFLYVSWAKHP